VNPEEIATRELGEKISTIVIILIFVGIPVAITWLIVSPETFVPVAFLIFVLIILACIYWTIKDWLKKLKHKDFIEKQKAKGLLFYEGKWLTSKEKERVLKEKQKEENNLACTTPTAHTWDCTGAELLMQFTSVDFFC